MKTLGDALPEEQARVREVLALYKELGSNGHLGALLIEDALRRADQAVISGDPIAMLRVYEELKNIE
jgi:hypothetical protein